MVLHKDVTNIMQIFSNSYHFIGCWTKCFKRDRFIGCWIKCVPKPPWFHWLKITNLLIIVRSAKRRLNNIGASENEAGLKACFAFIAALYKRALSFHTERGFKRDSWAVEWKNGWSRFHKVVFFLFFFFYKLDDVQTYARDTSATIKDVCLKYI